MIVEAILTGVVMLFFAGVGVKSCYDDMDWSPLAFIVPVALVGWTALLIGLMG